MKNIKYYSVFFILVFLLCSCDKKGITELKIIDITYDQTEVLYTDEFVLEEQIVLVSYNDDTAKSFFLDETMFLETELHQLRESGTHSLTIEIAGYTTEITFVITQPLDVVIYSLDFVDPGPIEISDFVLEDYYMKITYPDMTFNNVYFKKSLFSLSDLEKLMSPGIHRITFNYKSYSKIITLVLKQTDLSDTREVSNVKVPQNVRRDLSLMNTSIVEDHLYSLIGYVTYVDDHNIFIHDGVTGLYIKTNASYDLKYGDEIMIRGYVKYMDSNSSTRYIEADDVYLISKNYPLENEVNNYFLEDVRSNKMKLDKNDQVYRLHALYTMLEEKYIFTNGIDIIENVEMDNKTKSELDKYIDQVVEITIYYKYSYINPYFVTNSEISNVEPTDSHYTDFNAYLFDFEIMKIIKEFPEAAYKAEQLVLPNKGYFGSDITWSSEYDNIISDSGIINPALRSTTQGSMRFTIKNGYFNRSHIAYVWAISGDSLTISAANRKYLNDIGDAVISGIVYETYKGIALIYDGTGFATVKYDGDIGDVITIYGYYQYLDGFIGSFDSPFIIRASNETFSSPEILDLNDIDNVDNSSEYIGKIYETEGVLTSLNTYSVFKGFELLGSREYNINAHEYEIDGSDRKIILVEDKNFNLESLVSVESKLVFIPLRVNDDNCVEGLIVDINLE